MIRVEFLHPIIAVEDELSCMLLAKRQADALREKPCGMGGHPPCAAGRSRKGRRGCREKAWRAHQKRYSEAAEVGMAMP